MKTPHSSENTRKFGDRSPKPRDGLMERLPVEILTFLAADPARMARFFDITGLDAANLRKAAGTPDFESSLLEYLCLGDALLRDFAALHGYDPAEVDQVRVILAGPHGHD